MSDLAKEAQEQVAANLDQLATWFTNDGENYNAAAIERVQAGATLIRRLSRPDAGWEAGRDAGAKAEREACAALAVSTMQYGGRDYGIACARIAQAIRGGPDDTANSLATPPRSTRGQDMIVCSRTECQTTAGCAHRGPRFEMCWFPEPASHISELEVALAAETARADEIEKNGLSNCCVNDVTEPCGPFVALQRELDEAQAALAAAKAENERLWRDRDAFVAAQEAVTKSLAAEGSYAAVLARPKWTCAAAKQGSAGGNDPADCDWPFCGCDPVAEKVLGVIEELGWVIADPEAAAVAEERWR